MCTARGSSPRKPQTLSDSEQEVIHGDVANLKKVTIANRALLTQKRKKLNQLESKIFTHTWFVSIGN